MKGKEDYETKSGMGKSEGNSKVVIGKPNTRRGGRLDGVSHRDLTGRGDSTNSHQGLDERQKGKSQKVRKQRREESQEN